MKELRILLAIRTMAYGGGAERLVFDIFQELKKRKNIKVKLVSFQHSSIFNLPNLEYFEEKLHSDNDFCICNSSVSFSVFKKNKISIEEYVGIVEEFQPDIIHSHMFISELITRAKIYSKAKYFTHCHDNMVQFEKFSIHTLFDKVSITNYYERSWILKKYTTCNNQFITISNDTNKYFKKSLPKIFNKNIHLLKNAIDFNRFNNGCKIRDIKKINLINVGGFLPKKNQIFLVEVIKVLSEMKVDVSLTCLGNGSELEMVKRKTNEYGLNSLIEFPGNVSNVEAYLNKANLYVHSAYYEPFGLVLLEAMATGLPVIALNGKGNSDIVLNNKTGFLMDEQNAVLFAKKIISLMNDENTYRQMSQNAVEFSQKFDIKNYVDRLLTLYKSKIK